MKAGFEQLVRQYQRDIYLYISRLTRGADETEDLFQETFLRAHKAYARLPEEANVRAWLFKIATNLCSNYFRRVQRHHEVHTVVAYAQHRGNGLVADDPEQYVLSKDLERRVLAVIEALPLKQKAALIQRKVHGLPYDSIATSLQCSLEAARAHVYQALKRIREAMEETPNAGPTSRNDLVKTARASL